MLKILITSIFGTLVLSATAQTSFSVKGKITGAHDGQTVILKYNAGGKMLKDSTLIKKGNFLFKGKVYDAVKAKITLKDLKKSEESLMPEKMDMADEQEFFLENKSFSVEGDDVKNALIKGGEAQMDYLKLNLLLKPLQDKMKPLSAKMRQYYKEHNDKAGDELFPQVRAIRVDMNKVEEVFIQQHPDSYVTLDMLSRIGANDVEKIRPAFNLLSLRIKGSVQGKLLEEQLKISMKTSVGKPALNFTQNNTEGRPVALVSLKGKYVLLDFWASWCGPCRAENPNLVKAYQKFKDKNFEILGVSLDSEKENWVKAIQTDGLIWIHVSDLKGWSNSVADMYNIKAVPQNFLIGPDGIILSKNLYGEELEKKLDELIGNEPQL